MRKNEGEKIQMSDMAQRRGIPVEVIEKIIESQYQFIREKITELDFGDDLTREEFDKLKTNFNIPCIGKMYASYYVYDKINGAKKNQKLSRLRRGKKSES